jgi:flagellar hook assembly protein FlgD
MDFNASTGIIPGQLPNEAAFSLNQNFPNPFNPDTIISFSLETTGKVELDIYNAKGQLIRKLVRAFYPEGEHTIRWNGKTDDQKMAPSGIYFYRMSQNGEYKHRKMTLMK